MVLDNAGRAVGCPPALEGTDETGIEGWAPYANGLGGLGIDITLEVVGWYFDLGCVVLLHDL